MIRVLADREDEDGSLNSQLHLEVLVMSLEGGRGGEGRLETGEGGEGEGGGRE